MTDNGQSSRFFGGSRPLGLKGNLRRSLVARFGCYLIFLASLALISMFSALLFADYTHQDAAVINHSGSLRMLTYRSALEPDVERRQQLLNTLRERLNSPDIHRLLQRKDTDSVLVQLHSALESEIISIDPFRMPSRRVLDGYVEDIDHFVGILQSDAEKRSQILSTVQGLCLFLSLVVVFITLYDLTNHVIGPLNQLTKTARLLGQGRLDARVIYSGEDELSQLGERFNQMASELQTIYGDLEQRVEEKTLALQRSKQRLELLYASVRRLVENPYDNATLQSLLNRLDSVLDAGAITLCLNKDGIERSYSSLSSSSRTPSFSQQNCQRLSELAANSNDAPQQQARLFVQPLMIGDHRFGDLFIQGKEQTLQNWQKQLVQTFCDNIARAFALDLQKEQESRLALLNERNTIARELHDSLAQSLSYLKIQVSRVSTLINRQAPIDKIEETLTELREGLNNAYSQLRELLTTFRLSLEQPTLQAALQNAAEEFAERGAIRIVLENQLTHIPLTPNEEVHILQIVREALSNVVRHANAQMARIRLHQTDDSHMEVIIEDDGIGFEPETIRPSHYGMTIMHERSQTLGGELYYHRRKPRGTSLVLRFIPQTLRRFHEGEQR